jgi:hypothetical protein
MSVKNWSTTPASNASVDSINFAELQNPSTLNDSARTLMADVAEWYALIKGGTVVGGTVAGTADAITLATTPSPYKAAYATGDRFLVKVTGANTLNNPTLNVAALGAKTIVLPGGGVLATPQWATNDMLLLVYDGTNLVLLGGQSVVAGATLTLTRNAQVGTSYTILTGDRAKWVTYSNASAVAVVLPQANGTTFGGGWYSYHENIGAGVVTITPATSTINTGTAIVLRQGEWALIESDNTNYRALHTGQITGSPSAREQGTRGVPLNTQNVAYSFVLSDAGGCVFHDEVTARVYTIPANASVAFPIGTAITIINNNGAGTITLSITTDTLRRGDGTAGTGSRTIIGDSIATIIKTKATEWMISGVFT